MSTNIRLYLEYKPTDEYELFAEIHGFKDYELFGLMANVRYEPDIMRGIAPVSHARGLPEDTSSKISEKYEEYLELIHSESWLNTDEFEDVYRRYMQIPAITEFDAPLEVPSDTEYFELRAIIDMMKRLDTHGSQPRLVFWFIG